MIFIIFYKISSVDDGTEFLKLKGDNIAGRVVEFDATSIQLLFHSDGSVQKRGFYAYFKLGKFILL